MQRWRHGAWRAAAAIVTVGAIAGSASGGNAGADEPAGAVGKPVVATYGDGGRIQVRTRTGNDLASFSGGQFASLDGNVLARSRQTSSGGSEMIVVSNATTGATKYRIRNAFAPVVTHDGERVVFAPDRYGHRDPYGSSLWLRTGSGSLRRVFQLTGPHATVPDDPFDGEAIPLSWSTDEQGRMLAVALGNDVTFFEYDVWVIDMRTTHAQRITSGKASRFPSMSPDGTKVALTREIDECGGPPPGYRATKVQIVKYDNSSRRVLVDGSCAEFLVDPRWVSDNLLSAVRLTRVDPGKYVAHLVLVHTGSGAVDQVATGGAISYTDTSPTSGLVAFVRRSDPAGYRLLNPVTGKITKFGGGFIPHLAGDHHLV